MGVVKRSTKPRKNLGDKPRAEGELLEITKSKVSELSASIQGKSNARSIKDFRFQVGRAVFKDGVRYLSIIQDIYDRKKEDGTRTLVVNAEAEDDKGDKESFAKFFDLVETESSTVYRFCEKFNAVTDSGEINIDELVGKKAIVTLYTSKNGKKYISTIYPAVDVDEDTDEEYTYEEDDEYSYDNDYTYNDGEDDGCIYEP